jgi:hypothetical protein
LSTSGDAEQIARYARENASARYDASGTAGDTEWIELFATMYARCQQVAPSAEQQCFNASKTFPTAARQFYVYAATAKTGSTTNATCRSAATTATATPQLGKATIEHSAKAE